MVRESLQKIHKTPALIGIEFKGQRLDLKWSVVDVKKNSPYEDKQITKNNSEKTYLDICSHLQQQHS